MVCDFACRSTGLMLRVAMTEGGVIVRDAGWLVGGKKWFDEREVTWTWKIRT